LSPPSQVKLYTNISFVFSSNFKLCFSYHVLPSHNTCGPKLEFSFLKMSMDSHLCLNHSCHGQSPLLSFLTPAWAGTQDVLLPLCLNPCCFSHSGLVQKPTEVSTSMTPIKSSSIGFAHSKQPFQRGLNRRVLSSSRDRSTFRSGSFLVLRFFYVGKGWKDHRQRNNHWGGSNHPHPERWMGLPGDRGGGKDHLVMSLKEGYGSTRYWEEPSSLPLSSHWLCHPLNPTCSWKSRQLTKMVPGASIPGQTAESGGVEGQQGEAKMS